MFIAGNKICEKILSKNWKEAKLSYKLILTVGIKVSYEVILWSSIFEVLKVTILQYLYNI